MHCGVMATGYGQGDWEGLLAGDYRRPEKSLRLFADKVLPAVQAMPTPINPASLGQPRS